MKQYVPEQLDLESSFTFKIYSDYACLKVGRETLRTIDRFLEQSRSVQSIYSTYSLQHHDAVSRRTASPTHYRLSYLGPTFCFTVFKHPD